MFLLLPMASSVCYGLDTDLYVLSGANIPPNVLIIMDSSASMDEVTSGQNYDPNIDYSAYGPPTVYPRDAVYVLNKKTWDPITITCADLINNYLTPFGMATNYSNVSCGISKKDFQTGNFLNYVQLTGGVGGSRPRFGLQNGIIHSYINTTNGVRFAVMTSNTDKDGKKVLWDSIKEKVFGDNRDDPLDAVGGKLLGFVDENKNGKTDLFKPYLDTRMKPGLPWLKRYTKQASISRERGARSLEPIIQALSNIIVRRTISSSSLTGTPQRIATLSLKIQWGSMI